MTLTCPLHGAYDEGTATAINGCPSCSVGGATANAPIPTTIACPSCDALRARAEKAEAACASLREALDEILDHAVEQKSVLERVAVDVLTALAESDPANGADGARRGARLPVPPRSAAPPLSAAAPDGERRHWQAIVAYCEAHGAAKAHRCVDVAEALLPEKVKEGKKGRNVAVATIHTTAKRRSVGESDHPYFIMLGKGKFRLATAEERTKAKEARDALARLSEVERNEHA
jgi:rubredoxin